MSETVLNREERALLTWSLLCFNGRATARLDSGKVLLPRCCF